MEKGTKYDLEKLDWSLLPWESLEEVVKVLEFGAKKYSRDNWQFVKPKERYDQAALRHRIAYQQGEKIDPESGYSHLAHEVCCCLFKIWEDNQEEECEHRYVRLTYSEEPGVFCEECGKKMDIKVFCGENQETENEEV